MRAETEVLARPASGPDARKVTDSASHVDNCAPAHDPRGQLPGGRTGSRATHRIGAATELADLDLARRICAIFDRIRPQQAPHHRLITFVPDPGHDWRYAVDGSRLAQDLGWRPQEELETGLEKTVARFLARPGRARAVTTAAAR